MSEKKSLTTLTNINEFFLTQITSSLEGQGVKMDDYSKLCAVNAISTINGILSDKGLSWNNEEIDRGNIQGTILAVTTLKLNAAAIPAEIYFELRNKSVTVGYGDSAKKVWKKQIDWNVEGDGYDALLANFGRDVKKVGKFWEVREGDKFEYPSFNGLDMTPPKWSPTGKGKVIRIVYPIVKTDGTVEFLISEREDCIKNLRAHIKNNLMNETFDIVKDRKEAGTADKKKIAAKKAELLKCVDEKGLDIIYDPDFEEYISPAWRDNLDSMLVRKMRNNATRKYPKDFGNGFARQIFEDATDEEAKQVHEEIADKANKVPLDEDKFHEVENDGDSKSKAAASAGDTQEVEKSDDNEPEKAETPPEGVDPETGEVTGQDPEEAPKAPEADF
jgi:hypothetical protein